MKNVIIKKIATLSMFLALAILLNYVENFIPTFVPGVKLGLANTMNLIILYFYGRREYFLIGFLRVLIIGLLFNGIFSYSFFYSLSGFLLSCLVVIGLSYIKKLSLFSLSVVSAMCHGIGQIICSIVLNWTADGTSIYMLTYLPLLLVTGVITGILIAYLSSLIISRLEKTPLFKSMKI